MQQIKLWDHLSDSLKEAAADQQTSYDYRLFGVICHQGGQTERGHYIALCRTGETDETWYTFPLFFRVQQPYEKVAWQKEYKKFTLSNKIPHTFLSRHEAREV